MNTKEVAGGVKGRGRATTKKKTIKIIRDASGLDGDQH
jgi:hypothetical protein